MSFRLMKERIKVTGHTPREEMIRDGQNLLKEELEHDSSYSPTMFFYDSDKKVDDRLASLRVYGRKYSSLNGNYMCFITTYDNPIKIGEYIHDMKDDTYWLVYNSFNVNDVHYEGKLIQCNYLLKWQLSNGKIVERWANVVSASKYDTGETGNATIVLSSNNFTVLIGFCEEGYELEGKRVFIDKRNVNPEKVFKITRGDDVLFDSGSMGAIMSFIADKTELNKNVDRQDLKLCNYIDVDKDTSRPNVLPIEPENPNETPDLRAFIQGSQYLKVGLARTYTANVTGTDEHNAEWDDGFSWNVVADFMVTQELNGNKIKLIVEDEEFIGSSFSLQIIQNNITVVADYEITIVPMR